MILFYARKRYATCSSDDRLTTGSVGIRVEFTFSEDWAVAPARIAVFRGSGVSVDVALLEDSCTVPPEVLTQPGSTLTIGVYGTDGASTVVIPTVYAEAGQIKRGAEPSGIEPTPQTQPLIDQLLAAAQAARNAADEAERLAKAVKDAADAGEFDGTRIWWTTARVLPYDSGGGVSTRKLNGVAGATPAVRDYVFAPEIEQSGEPTTLYVITQTTAVATAFDRLCRIKGANGTSPSVTITEITGGHRITITDEAHPDGQSFDVMDGQGGGGGITVDDALSGSSTNPVQNKVVKAALDGKYAKPAGGIPASDLAEDVQTSLTKANTALQQHQDISGKADKPTEVTVSTAGDVTQALDAGKIYHFTGSLTALTLTLNSPAAGQQAQYHFDFDCGSTAPTVTIPNSVTMPSGNFEASKHYEVDILNNYGMVMAWATS